MGQDDNYFIIYILIVEVLHIPREAERLYWLPGLRGPTVSNGWVSQMSVTRPYHGR
jgi:hypothetical protein